MENKDKIQNIKKTHPFRIWDIAVYVLIAAATVILLIAASAPQGATVRINYYNAAGNVKTLTKPLDKDGVIEVPLTDGHKFIIKIEGGKVWAEESDCQDKVCIGMGKISRVNQQIICLPNKVTITITGESTSDGIV